MIRHLIPLCTIIITLMVSHHAHASDCYLFDRVVAQINDVVILQSDVEFRIKPFLANLAKIPHQADRKQQQAVLYKQALNELINEEIILLVAHQSNITIADKEIQAAIEDIKQRNRFTDQSFSQAMASQGYTYDSYKDNVKKQMTTMRTINSMIGSEIQINQEDIEQEYKIQGERAPEIKEAYLHHILLTLPKQPSKKDIARIKSKAATIISQNQKGKSFASLAKQFSQDPLTMNDEGALGWFNRKTIISDWEDVVFSMKQGDIRGPILSPAGFHVFHVSKIKTIERPSFKQQKNELKNKLFQEKLTKKTQRFVEEKRREFYVSMMPSKAVQCTP